MNQKTTGGPAFPTAEFIHDEVVHTGGMTMRDYFAAKASEEDINAHILKGHKEEHVIIDFYGKRTVIQRQARWTREEARYRYADAMLEARGTA